MSKERIARERADRCLSLAGEAVHEVGRARLLAMAQFWLEQAARAEVKAATGYKEDAVDPID